MTLHLAAALDGAGWHPAAWRDPRARPADLFDASYWTLLAAEAEHGLLDFVTFEDSLGPPSDRSDHVQGRLDAVLLAARLAPRTSYLGLVPTTSTTHTEPFHVSIGIAALDFASQGRAGWRPQISHPSVTGHFGRRSDFTLEGLVAEAADAVEVVRRMWDSWEDDAEIRDTATGRFVDRDKLHYIDFEGDFFSVRGPSITPRPPQGQPLVTALAHSAPVYEFTAASADIVYITPHSAEQASRITGQVRAAEAATGRTGEPLKVFGDLVVFIGDDAAARKGRLDELDGAEYTSDAYVFTGTAAELADLLLDWGLPGYRLRPGVLPADLLAITRDLVPELQRRGVFRTAYTAATLRGHLGLARPANRYVEVLS